LERLFLNAQGVEIFVELDHTVALRVAYRVSEYHGTLGNGCRPAQQRRQAVTVKQVVAQDHAHRLALDEIGADEKRLRQPARFRLLGVLKAQPPLLPTAQQTPVSRQVIRRADDQNLADAGQHQHRERVIHHWFVIYRQELLAHPDGDRVKARAFAACQDDSFHLTPPDRLA
jgi:hypothetical protein